MKIMTFNTQHCENFITKKIDYKVMASLIKKFDPDVVGLNEMRGKGERADYEAQTEMLSTLTGMPYYYFAKAIDVGGNNPYGNAILSKIPFEKVENIPIPDPDDRAGGGYFETRCLLKATLKNDVTVLVTHFGLNPSEHVNAVKTVLNNLKSAKCVLVGDFNVTPDNSVLAPIFERMQDSAIMLGENKLTFPSNAPNIKIDYIFASHDFKLVSALIPKDIASDHLPIICELV